MKRIVILLIVHGFMIQIAGTGPCIAADDEKISPPVPKRVNPCLTQEQIDLDERATGAHPLCSELKNTGNPVARKVGDDWIIVFPDPTNDRYIKFAVHIPDDGSTPVTIWQGASLAGAIEFACEEEVR